MNVQPLIGLGIWYLLSRETRSTGPPIDAGDLMATDPPQGYSVRVQALAFAIARAEGWFVAGSVPRRLNNPGDLKASSVPSIGADAHGHLSFATIEDGWRALHRQIQLWADGRSRVMEPYARSLGKATALDLTIEELARKYAQANDAWAANVAAALGVSPRTTTLREVL